MDWIEKQPIEGDTVKVEFSEFTNLGIKIGVYIRPSSGRLRIDFGDCIRYLDSYTTFFVLTK